VKDFFPRLALGATVLSEGCSMIPEAPSHAGLLSFAEDVRISWK
jgi:hypothetical protein